MSRKYKFGEKEGAYFINFLNRFELYCWHEQDARASWANKGIAVSGAEIHPTLANKLPQTSTNAYKLGNCAECDAVNQALHDGANWGDLQMHTVGVQWNTGATFPKPLCSNCEVTFTGIEIIL